MRRTRMIVLTGLGLAGALALGLAVATLGSSSSSAAPLGTSETTTTTTKSTTTTTTTTPTSTSEQPETTRFSARLGRASEVPQPVGAPRRARGVFAATFVHAGGTYTLTWKLTFSYLSGKAVAAHVHSGGPGAAGPVVLPLCGPCHSGQTGTQRVSSAVAIALNGGPTYVNVHTARNRAGEIRGRIARVG